MTEIERQLRAIRPGITSAVHHVAGLGDWGELEIRGVLVGDVAMPPIPTFDRTEHIALADILAALADFRARGVRVVLVRIHCAGGTTDAGEAVEEAFRAFSAGGGTLITFVDRIAASSASTFALVADFVAMSPAATFVVHRALPAGQRDLRPLDDPGLEAVNRRALRVYLERTLADPEDLARWVHLGPNDRGQPTHAELDAETAYGLGWTDIVVEREALVPGLVHAALAGVKFHRPRRAGGAVSALRTANYAEDTNGNPTAGAKLENGGVAMKCAPMNLQIGTEVFSGIPVIARYQTSAAGNLSNAIDTVCQFNTSILDTHSAVTTGSAWKFTVPSGKGGHYFVNCVYSVLSLTADTGYISLILTKNGASVANGYQEFNRIGLHATRVSSIFASLVGGDEIQAIVNQSNGGVREGGGSPSYIEIWRLQL